MLSDIAMYICIYVMISQHKMISLVHHIPTRYTDTQYKGINTSKSVSSLSCTAQVQGNCSNMCGYTTWIGNLVVSIVL